MGKGFWSKQKSLPNVNGNGGVTARYIRGIGLIAGDVGIERSYYSFNAHGDVVQLSDETGTVVKEYRYDAFGVEQSPDSEDANVWRYCGEYFDAETGTVYLRARVYDPVVGRFTQQDTTLARKRNVFDPYGDYQEVSLVGGVYAGEEGEEEGLSPFIVNDPLSLNLYAYTTNNPVMFVDPDGHFAILTALFIFGGTLLCAGVAISGGLVLSELLNAVAKAIYDYAQKTKAQSKSGSAASPQGPRKPSLKKLTRNSTEKLCKKYGFKDEHALKKDVLGEKSTQIAKFNIKVDTVTRRIYLENSGGVMIRTDFYHYL